MTIDNSLFMVDGPGSIGGIGNGYTQCLYPYIYIADILPTPPHKFFFFLSQCQTFEIDITAQVQKCVGSRFNV